MRKSTRSLLALTAVVSFSAAACGSSDETPVDEPSVTDPSGDTTATTEAMEDTTATTEAMEDTTATTEAMEDTTATTVGG